METNSINVEVAEDEVRNDLIDQITAEAGDVDPCGSDETPETEGGLNYGLIGGLGALGVGVVTGGIVLYKKIKSGAVKQKLEECKEHRKAQKDKRACIKEIKAKYKEDIKQILAAPVETSSEVTTETPVVEEVDNKKSSKK